MFFASVLVSVLFLIVLNVSLYKDSDSRLTFSLLEAMNVTTECPKKRPLRIFRTSGEYFPKLILNCKN